MIREKKKVVLISVLSIYLIFIFVPLLSATEYTFKTSVKGKYSLENYQWVLNQPEFIHYVLRSRWLSALSVLISIALLLPLQTWLHISQSRWRPVVETISLMPLIIPVVAFAIGAQVAMPLRIQDSVLELPFLYSMLSLPYVYRAIDIGLSTKPIKTWYESARVLGAHSGKSLLRAVFPGIKASILASAALGFALCIGEFTLTSLLHWDTFPTWINDVSQGNVLGAITLSIVSLVVPVSTLTIFAFVLTRRRKEQL